MFVFFVLLTDSFHCNETFHQYVSDSGLCSLFFQSFLDAGGELFIINTTGTILGLYTVYSVRHPLTGQLNFKLVSH